MSARYSLSRALFLRGVGVVYTVAFLSLRGQASGLFGERGILPATAFLAAQRAALGVLAPFHLPTLFWLDASDWFLSAVAIMGAIGALAAVAGFASPLLMAALWASYLSFVTVGQVFTGYPWDLLLLETGFLAIFMALGSGREHRSEEPRIVVFLSRWLLFRVLVGAGIAKLRSDPCWSSLSCLPEYLESSAAPTFLAPYFHALPFPVHRVATFVILFSEIVVPFGLFGPTGLRRIAAAITIAMQAMGLLLFNAGFGGALIIVLSFTAIDDECWARVLRREIVLDTRGELARSRRLLLRAMAALLVGLSLIELPSTWSPEPGTDPSLEPFHLVNRYGAIEPVERERDEVVFEGTADDAAAATPVRWLAYELACGPREPESAPCLPALRSQRLELRLWRAAQGDFRREPWVVRVVDDLLRENRAVTEFFSRDPFAGNPPRFVHALRYRYRYSRAGEAGFWQREAIGEFIRPFSLKDPALYEYLFRRGWLRKD